MPGAIGDAMVTSLQRTLPAVYEDTLRNVVLSLFERSCQEMFQQVDEAFRRGTVECKKNNSKEGSTFIIDCSIVNSEISLISVWYFV